MLLTRGVIILIIIDVIDQHLAVSRSIDGFISAFDFFLGESKAIHCKKKLNGYWVALLMRRYITIYANSTARQIVHGFIDENVR
jgi:hypothetical protein